MLTVATNPCSRVFVCFLFLITIAYSFQFSICTAGDSMRCGSNMVSTGDTKSEVISRCGEPASKEVMPGKYWTKEEWTYNFVLPSFSFLPLGRYVIAHNPWIYLDGHLKE